jgi:hypothetical protein
MLPIHLRHILPDIDYGRGAHRLVLVLLLQTEEAALLLCRSVGDGVQGEKKKRIGITTLGGGLSP